MANKDDPETLLSVMDEAAEALISLVKDVDLTKTMMERPTVSEKIKAFEALTDYMKYREKPSAGATTKSKFQSMQDKFNGGDHKTKGRGGRSGTAAEPETDDSPPGSVQ